MSLFFVLFTFISFNLLLSKSSDVIELTDGDFDEKTQIGTGRASGTWLIEFYAPWCGHCKKLAPIYEEVATGLKDKVNVAKVDATTSKEIASRFGIRGYPSVYLFRGDKMIKYSGARTKQNMIDWASNEDTQVTDPIPAKGSQASQASQDKKSAPAKTQIQQKNFLISSIETIIKIFRTETLPAAFILLFGILCGLLIGLICGTSLASPSKPPPPPSLPKSNINDQMNNHITKENENENANENESESENEREQQQPQQPQQPQQKQKSSQNDQSPPKDSILKKEE